MAKAFWIAHVRVEDMETYKGYIEANAAAFEKYGARFLARGGAFEEMEGHQGRDRHVVIEFESLQKAIDCYNSPEYAAAKAKRAGAADAYMVMVEALE